MFPDEPVALGGYSLGGRVALHVARRHGHRISRLVLLGASRGISDDVERRARRTRDEALATRIEEIGTDRFLDEWLSQPMFASLPRDERERTSRSQDPLGLASSLRTSGAGTQEWLEPELPTLGMPTLALAGKRDVKFSVEAEAIAGAVGHGAFILIEDAGHAAHLEQPDATARAVQAFLLNG